ncbi:voltage-dependent potassium channel beta subunit [Colletotrichum abscissum]|uniref:voltage-dependent potassium channel beta subunit n=1 Tax=Colletotrichum abscissum TaxID=1671311 RepID=UPI0027D4DDC0|nr:voltage-dependent potassium channel beta subunit [Colletotrichum abscissum]KAK1483220.1 voltage-dependent potassium channel beta subunit [Colletotrichum abscissum]
MAWEEPRKTGMQYRRLGNSGLHVSVLGLGGWLTHVSPTYFPTRNCKVLCRTIVLTLVNTTGSAATLRMVCTGRGLERIFCETQQTFACMKQAYDLGVNFFDTAESYAGGNSEIIMGQAIKKFNWNRNDIVVTTKLNWGGANGQVLVNNHGLSRKHIIEGLRASLKRLDLEYVDIVYAHRPDRLTPMEETVRAFNHVIDKGYAMYWGTSEWSADEIAEACGVAKDLRMIAPVVEQPQYNILERRKVEYEFQRLYQRFGLGLTVFSPIKMGLLSGKYNDDPDAPPAGSRFAEGKGDKFVNWANKEWYGNDEWKALIQNVVKLKGIAEKLGATQSQLALAWCLKNPNVTSVITGASRPEQIVENVGALKVLEKLTPEIMAEVDAIVGEVKLDPARQD